MSLLLRESQTFLKGCLSDEGNDMHINTCVGCALTCSQDQKAIVRPGPNKELNQTSNKNLSAQIHVLNPFQTSLSLPLKQLLQKQNLAEQPRTLGLGSAQSFSMQHSDHIPGNHRNAPCKENIHHFHQWSFQSHLFKHRKKKKKKRLAESKQPANQRHGPWQTLVSIVKRSHK